MPTDQQYEQRWAAGLGDYVTGAQPMQPVPRNPAELAGHSSLLEDAAGALIDLGQSRNRGVRGQGRRKIASLLDLVGNATGLTQGAGFSTRYESGYQTKPLTRDEEIEIFRAKEGNPEGTPILRNEDLLAEQAGAGLLQLQARRGETMLDGASAEETAGDRILQSHARTLIDSGQAKPQEIEWAQQYLTETAKAQQAGIDRAEKQRSQTARGPEDYAKRVHELKTAGFDDHAIADIMEKGNWNKSWTNPSFIQRLQDEQEIAFLHGDLGKAMDIKNARLSLLKQGLGDDANFRPSDLMMDDMAKHRAQGGGMAEAFSMGATNAFFASVRGLHRLAGTLPPGDIDRDILERYATAAADEHSVAAGAGEIVGGIADPVFLALDLATAGIPVGKVAKAAFIERKIAQGVPRVLAESGAKELALAEFATEGISTFVQRKWGMSARTANAVGNLIWNGASGAVAGAGAAGLQVAPEDMTPGQKALAVAQGAAAGGVGAAAISGGLNLLGFFVRGGTKALRSALGRAYPDLPPNVSKALENGLAYADNGIAGHEVAQEVQRGVSELARVRQAVGRPLAEGEIRAVLAQAGVDLEHLGTIKPETPDQIRQHLSAMDERLASPELPESTRKDITTQYIRGQRVLAEAGDPEHVRAQPNKSDVEAQVAEQLRQAVPDEQLKSDLAQLEAKGKEIGELSARDAQHLEDTFAMMRDRGIEISSPVPAPTEGLTPAEAFRAKKWDARRQAILNKIDRGTAAETLFTNVDEPAPTPVREQYKAQETPKAANHAETVERLKKMTPAQRERVEAQLPMLPESQRVKLARALDDAEASEASPTVDDSGRFNVTADSKLDATTRDRIRRGYDYRRYEPGSMMSGTSLANLDSIAEHGLTSSSAHGGTGVWMTEVSPKGTFIPHRTVTNREGVPIVFQLRHEVRDIAKPVPTKVGVFLVEGNVPTSMIEGVYIADDPHLYTIAEAQRRLKDNATAKDARANIESVREKARPAVPVVSAEEARGMRTLGEGLLRNRAEALARKNGGSIVEIEPGHFRVVQPVGNPADQLSTAELRRFGRLTMEPKERSRLGLDINPDFQPSQDDGSGPSGPSDLEKLLTAPDEAAILLGRKNRPPEPIPGPRVSEETDAEYYGRIARERYRLGIDQLPPPPGFEVERAPAVEETAQSLPAMSEGTGSAVRPAAPVMDQAEKPAAERFAGTLDEASRAITDDMARRGYTPPERGNLSEDEWPRALKAAYIKQAQDDEYVLTRGPDGYTVTKRGETGSSTFQTRDDALERIDAWKRQDKYQAENGGPIATTPPEPIPQEPANAEPQSASPASSEGPQGPSEPQATVDTPPPIVQATAGGIIVDGQPLVARTRVTSAAHAQAVVDQAGTDALGRPLVMAIQSTRGSNRGEHFVEPVEFVPLTTEIDGKHVPISDLAVNDRNDKIIGDLYQNHVRKGRNYPGNLDVATVERIDGALSRLYKDITNDPDIQRALGFDPEVRLRGYGNNKAEMIAAAKKIAAEGKKKGTAPDPMRARPPFKSPTYKLPKPSASDADRIKAIMDATSTEPNRFSLNGYLVEPDGRTIVVTDGRRMWFHKSALEDKAEPGTYLPNGKNKPLALSTDPEKKFPEGYQEYLKFADGSEPIFRHLDLDRTVRTLRKAQVLVGDDKESRGVVLVRNPDGSLGAFARTAETGVAQVNVRDGFEQLGAVNPRFLIEQLEWHARGHDRSVNLFWEGPTKPITTKGTDTIGVMMPINTNIDAPARMREEFGIKRKPLPKKETGSEPGVEEADGTTEVSDRAAPSKPEFAKLGDPQADQSAATTGPYTPNLPLIEGPAEGVVTQYRDVLRPVPMPELLKIAQALGVDPRIKALTGARGVFGHGGSPIKGAKGSEYIRLDPSIFADPEAAAKTLAHEIGHFIDYLDDRSINRGNLVGRVASLTPLLDNLGKLKVFMAETFPLSKYTNRDLRKELIDLSKFWKPYDPARVPDSYVSYRESAVELYADALSVILNSPGLMKERAPKFYSEWSRFIDRKPDVLAAMMDVQDLLAGTSESIMASRRADIREDFAKGEDIMRARAEERRRGQSVIEFVNQTLFDSAAPVITREKAAARRGIASAEARAAQSALEEFALRDNAARITLGKVKREVSDPLLALGISKEDAGEYLMMKRIAAGDRAAFGNPRGHTPQTASEMISDIEARMGPDKFGKFKKAMDRWGRIVFDVAQQAVDEGVYNQKTFDTTIAPNQGNYATFAVLDYLSDYIPAKIHQQVGTFKAVANPFDATLMKTVSLHRAIELNRAKRISLVEGVAKWSPEDAVYHKAGPFGKMPIPKPGNELVPFMVDGHVDYIETDPYIAKVFDRHDIGLLNRIGRAISSATYAVFHPVYVTFSPSFAVSNIKRDITRTYSNLAAAAVKEGVKPPSMAEVLKAYRDVSPDAWARAKGTYSPLVEELIESRALTGTPFSRYESEEAVGYEKLLESVGLNDHTNRGGFIGKIRELMNPVEQFSGWTEALPKLASWKLLADRGVGVDKRSYIVRNYVGTPNTARRGLATNLTNGVFMYSNVALQGLRADAELALHPKSAGAYWLRAMMTDYLPKLAMKAATLGAFGAGVKAMFDMIPEHDKAGYVVVPLGTRGEAGKEKAVYLRLPHGDTERMLASVAWLLMEGKPGKAAAQLYGQLPLSNLSPPIQVALAWKDYIQGRNPYDDFRNRDIIGKEEWTAGGWHAARDMMSWTADQFGVVSTLLHGFIGSRGGSDLTTTERIVGSIPGLERLIKTSDRGLTEDQWESIDLQEQERARFKLGLPEAAREWTKERYRLQRLRVGNPAALKPRDLGRLEQLNAWYRDAYLPLTRAMMQARDARDNIGFENLKAQLAGASGVSQPQKAAR